MRTPLLGPGNPWRRRRAGEWRRTACRAFPGRGSPGARGGICSRAPHSSLHWHEPPAASVCRWDTEEGDAVALAATRGAGAGSPPTLRPQVLAPTFWPRSRWRTVERRNRLSRTSPPLCHSLGRAEREREGRRPLGRPRDPRPPPQWGLRRSVRPPRLASLCAEFASRAPELARDPGGVGGR